MAKQIYNPFHLRPEYIEKAEPETQSTLSRLQQKFMIKASRHSIGVINSSARKEATGVLNSMEDTGTPIINRNAHAIAISQPRQNAMKAVMKNTSPPLSTTSVVVTSFISPFDEEEKTEANDSRGPKALPKRRKVYGNAINLAPTTVHSRMKAYLKGAQPAVVKMAGTGGGLQSASNLMRYISRHADMPLERENGQKITTLNEQNEMLQDWQHYLDKRKASRDVVTLTVNIKNPDIDPPRVQRALEAVYKEQRLVSGVVQSESEPDKIIAVITIASTKKGRIKTTDHALQQVKDNLLKKHDLSAEDIDLLYGNVGHGVHGLTQQFKAALQETHTLSGPKDDNVTIENSDKTARSWRRSLRSSGNRDIMHLIISARAGTDQSAILKSARSFLAHEFGDHKYAFALHGPDDTATDKRTGEHKATAHNHIHAMIVMRSVHEQKLNPNIEDFQRWRENMAFFARQYGIDMVATKRGETLSPDPYSKNEHELAKKGKAGKRIKEKIEAKRQRKKTAPTRRNQSQAILDSVSAVSDIRKKAIKENDQALSNAADNFISSYGNLDQLEHADEMPDKYHGRPERGNPQERNQKQTQEAYSNVMYDALNAHACYQKYGVIEPLIEAINQWSNLIKDDLKTGPAHQPFYLQKSIDEFKKLYGQISSAISSEASYSDFWESTKVGADDISRISAEYQKTSEKKRSNHKNGLVDMHIKR
ncbi:hypothetical protein [Bartonella tamiae]|uniref:Conjugal transfer protein TraA n=1 Tax=Bartonella tamiae Th239 TaxID=1094558 RepID=J0QWE5_9HYPH|nr:hypothetical protein [Bartonella tamiae]EJF90356.1 hypothetical protein ME5_00757 [Bartonella tamiae Th239]EJF93703.1 hypothetical protein MEG_01127 [Bartonella tamiae Th307]